MVAQEQPETHAVVKTTELPDFPLSIIFCVIVYRYKYICASNLFTGDLCKNFHCFKKQNLIGKFRSKLLKRKHLGGEPFVCTALGKTLLKHSFVMIVEDYPCSSEILHRTLAYIRRTPSGHDE